MYRDMGVLLSWLGLIGNSEYHPGSRRTPVLVTLSPLRRQRAQQDPEPHRREPTAASDCCALVWAPGRHHLRTMPKHRLDEVAGSASSEVAVNRASKNNALKAHKTEASRGTSSHRFGRQGITNMHSRRAGQDPRRAPGRDLCPGRVFEEATAQSGHRGDLCRRICGRRLCAGQWTPSPRGVTKDSGSGSSR
jgi:hypothetical protein